MVSQGYNTRGVQLPPFTFPQRISPASGAHDLGRSNQGVRLSVALEVYMVHGIHNHLIMRR